MSRGEDYFIEVIKTIVEEQINKNERKENFSTTEEDNRNDPSSHRDVIDVINHNFGLKLYTAPAHT